MSVYPGAIDDDSTLYVVADNIASVLSSPVGIGDATINVSSGTGFAVDMIVTVIDTVDSTGKATAYEHMLVTNVAGGVLSVTRGYAGTSATAHSSGKRVAVLIDAAHQQALRSAIVNIENALGVNLSNAVGVRADKYNFAAQAPGVDLGVGANVFTLNPIPPGIAVGDNLRISGGVGTAEVVPVTGWNSGTGQIIVTCANTHTGAWTIQSATAGIQEAANANPGSTVMLASGTSNVYAQITLSNVGLVGVGAGQSKIHSFITNTPVLYLTGPAGYYGQEVASLTFETDGTVTPVAGHWYIKGVNAAPWIHQVNFRGGYGHILLDTCPFAWITDIQEGDHTIGIQVGNGAGHGSSAMIENVVASSSVTGATWLFGRTGNVYVSNANSQMTAVSTTAHIYIAPSGASDGFGESQFSNIEMDGGGGPSLFVNPGGGASCYGMQFRGLMFTGGNNANHAAISAANCQNINFSNLQMRGLGSSALVALSGTQTVSFDHWTASDFTAPNVTALVTNAAVTGLAVRSSRVGYDSTGATNADLQYVFNFGSFSSTNVVIENNELYASGAVTVNPPADMSTWKVSGNLGIGNTNPSQAAAATVAFPFMDDGQMLTLTGSTAVTAVSGLRKGQFGYILATDAAPGSWTAGATIGNTLTPTQNVLVAFWFDGTKIWPK